MSGGFNFNPEGGEKKKNPSFSYSRFFVISINNVKNTLVSCPDFTPVDVREAPRKKYACSNGILPDSVSTPPPSSKRTLCGRYFSPKMGKFFETAILTLGMVILKITVVKHDS